MNATSVKCIVYVYSNTSHGVASCIFIEMHRLTDDIAQKTETEFLVNHTSGLGSSANKQYLLRWAFLQTRPDKEKRSRGKTEKGACPQFTN